MMKNVKTKINSTETILKLFFVVFEVEPSNGVLHHKKAPLSYIIKHIVNNHKAYEIVSFASRNTITLDDKKKHTHTHNYTIYASSIKI